MVPVSYALFSPTDAKLHDAANTPLSVNRMRSSRWIGEDYEWSSNSAEGVESALSCRHVSIRELSWGYRAPIVRLSASDRLQHDDYKTTVYKPCTREEDDCERVPRPITALSAPPLPLPNDCERPRQLPMGPSGTLVQSRLCGCRSP